MEPKYKVNPLTGELQEYYFEYNGILALRNFTAKVEDERLILHAADDVNFSILEALVSEVEINGVVYDNPTAAQEALTRLTFNQNRPVLLDKSLKDLILGAVQKVEGKGLSSNDFTNAYKQQLDSLEDYDIELDENTTELKFKKGNNVIKRISLMFLDDEGTKLVYNKANKTLELRDKRDKLLTSIPVSHFVSNIPTSIVVQNGKIKLMAGSEVIGENTISYNDLADKPELNFAPANHTHNWDDIQGKPNNLATTENVKSAVEDIEIGGRNYFLNSKFFKTTSFYVASGITVINKDNEGLSEIHSTSGNGNWVRIYDNPTNIDYFVDKYVTVSFDIKVLEGDLTSPTFYGGSFMNYQEMKPVSKKHEIGKWNRVYTTFLVVRDEFSIHLGFQYAIGKYQFKNFKFEIGNKPTDWTPAPEDIKEYDPVGNIINGTRQILPNEADKVIFVTNSVDNCALNVFPDKCSVSFRKVFDGGHVNFSCLGRNIIYTGDNQFNGKKGSTAVVSIYGNDCYIDIRNV
jgi:hypothetical protein|nr:MAG TPA: hypothetical protein [Caudoviricetes sp.]